MPSPPGTESLPTPPAPPSPKGVAGTLQAARRGETTALPASWPLAFQPCAQSLTFSAAGCRCVLCYRNSPAPGPLQALPLLHSETPHLPGPRGVRQDQREVLRSPLPSHMLLTEQSQVGPASPCSFQPQDFCSMSAITADGGGERFRKGRHEGGHKEKGV